MKKVIATVIAGLFATAAFAQTPAPAASKTSKPAAVLVNNADMKASKADTKTTVHAEAPVAQASVSANTTHEDAKPVAAPAHAKHAKSKPKHVAKAGTMKDKQDAASATPPAPLGQDAAPAPTPVDTQAPAATTAPTPDAAPVPATTPAPAAPVGQ